MSADDVPVWVYLLAYPLIVGVLFGVWLIRRGTTSSIHVRGFGVEITLSESSATKPGLTVGDEPHQTSTKLEGPD